MPSGKNKVPMARLREVLAAAGFPNARTYIQSGNAVINSKLSPRVLEIKIRELIKKQIGPDLAVMIRTGAQLQTMINENPFGETEGARMFFVLFSKPPAAAKIKTLLKTDFGEAKLAFTKRAAHMRIPENCRTKLGNNFLEKQCGVSATTRNLNTMRKLAEMCGE